MMKVLMSKHLLSKYLQRGACNIIAYGSASFVSRAISFLFLPYLGGDDIDFFPTILDFHHLDW